MEELEKNEDVEKRKEKVINNLNYFIKNKDFFIFAVILVIGILIRLYYFYLTKSQPLWWDEADYMSYAKKIAGIGSVDWIITEKHASIFPFIIAIFMKFISSEVILRFILEIIPSILLIILTYILASLMYKDKRVAIISSILMASLWEVLFNSFRFQLDIPALLLSLFAIYIFWQGYEKKEKIFGKISSKYALPLTVLLVVFIYAFRKSYVLFGGFFFVYMLLIIKWKELFKNKYNWLSLVLALVFLFLIQKFILFNSLDTSATLSDAFGSSFDFVPLQIFSAYFENIYHPYLSILTYLFWVGLTILIFNFLLSIGNLKKQEKGSELRADFFNLLAIIITLVFFIFLTRNGNLGDPRWYYPLLFSSFICISKATLLFADFIGRYSKPLGVAFILIIVLFGGYYELQHADFIIKNKIPTYQGIKDASLYLKQNSNLQDVIISVPVPQTAYYSERPSLSPAGLTNKSYNGNVSFDEFLKAIKDNARVRYVIVSFSEPNHPEWMRNESIEIFQNPQTGQAYIGKWQIPFMNTTIDFVNQKQDLKEEVTYGDLKFKLIKTTQDSFIYEIKRI